MNFWNTCLIDNSSHTSQRSFLNRLRVFKITSKEYYDRYHKTDGEGICYCGKPTSYKAFVYNKYCSATCFNKSDEHRDIVKSRFINSPEKLELFRERRGKVDPNTSKSKITRQRNAENLGITLYEYNSMLAKISSATISPERRHIIVQKGMETKASTGNFGGRSMYKEYKLRDEVVKVQGYEPIVLDYLQEIYDGKILAGKKNIPIVNYFYDKEHRYYPDIYLPEVNLLIEVKSNYTYSLHEEVTIAKMKASVEAGYSVLLVILTGNRMRKHGLDGYKNVIDWAISSQAPKLPTWYGEGSTTSS